MQSAGRDLPNYGVKHGLGLWHVLRLSLPPGALPAFRPAQWVRGNGHVKISVLSSLSKVVALPVVTKSMSTGSS